MAIVKNLVEGLLFGGKQEKEPEPPSPPPSDLEKEKKTRAMGLEDFTHTQGRLRGAPASELKKNLGME